MTQTRFWKWLYCYILAAFIQCRWNFVGKYHCPLHNLISSITMQSKILQIQNGGWPPYWKSNSDCSLASFCPINANFWKKKQTRTHTLVSWHNEQIWKIQESVRSSFLNGYFSILQREWSDFNEIWQADMQYASANRYETKGSIFLQIENSCRLPHWNCFWLHISAEIWNEELQNYPDTQAMWPKISKFWKFKMANGRHLESGICLCALCEPCVLTRAWVDSFWHK